MRSNRSLTTVGGLLFAAAVGVVGYMMLAAGQAVPGSDLFFVADTVRDAGMPPQITVLAIPVMMFAMFGVIGGAAMLLPRISEIRHAA